MIDNITLVAVSYIRPEIEGITGLEERFTAACREAHKFWLSTDDSLRISAAVAATLLETSDPGEKDRFERSAQALSALSSMLVTGKLDEINLPDGFVPFPILRIWHETRDQAGE